MNANTYHLITKLLFIMKKLILAIIVLAFGAFVYLKWIKKEDASATPEAEPTPMLVKTHSDNFNAKVDAVIANYLLVKDAFTNDDILRAKLYTDQFIASLDSIPVEELESDKKAVAATAKATIQDIKANAASLVKQEDITEMRKDFSMVTEMMYPAFFQSINYEGEKLYLQHCPMAFDNDQGANWLSKQDKIVNPYLGKIHPKYQATMINCGEVKDSVVAK